ncbi:MAG: type II toxin-antitoxin system death-on-curing family toxin [Micrococcales bacterium]
MPKIIYLQIRETALFVQEQGFYIRDVGLLESAIRRPEASVFGEDAYPDLSRKAAAMFSSIIRNHPMMDGNKRCSFILTMIFLRINGWTLQVDEGDMFNFIVTQAAKQEDLDEIEAFFVKHLVEY